MSWTPFDQGATIGTRGPESGIIRSDEEHALGARITLEHDASHAPRAITCGIYGWMFHTRYVGDAQQARAEYDAMKIEIDAILVRGADVSLSESDRRQAVSAAIGAFVHRFP